MIGMPVFVLVTFPDCSWIGLSLSCGITFLLSLIVYLFPVKLASIFSSDPNIHAIFNDIAGYLVCIPSTGTGAVRRLHCG